MEVKPQLKDLQLYITLGYLLLLLIGFLMDAIVYGLLGVNIMAYSDVFDLLISPISLLVGAPGLALILCLVGVAFWGLGALFKNKKWYQNFLKKLVKEGDNSSFESKVFTTYIFILGLFAGLGSSIGAGIKQDIQNKDYKLTHQITFRDAEVLKVNIIGQNTQYVFYVAEGEDVISISPIGSNIKKIKKLKEGD